MNADVNQLSIFLPVFVIVALTAIAFLRMAVARARATKERTDSATYYRAYQGPPEADYAIIAVRHYGNLFEAPVLFYAASIIAFAVGGVTSWLLVWAWGYVAARLVQSTIHLTFNNPLYRGLAFSISWLFLIALWVTLAMEIIGRL
ncbi:MAG: hypothetical protein EPO08_05320 [Rhodospirillaceae bacterium]|nr:MAG: hypothetical protein EPO08_05320 [Rhodospirillaceae bacterium]